MEYQPKLNAKYMPVLYCISSFEGASNEKLHDTTSPFVSRCLFWLFTSADMTFYKILELHSPFLSQILLF